MRWKYWTSEPPPQWPTREPVRPKLHGEANGWLMTRLVKETVTTEDGWIGLVSLLIAAGSLAFFVYLMRG